MIRREEVESELRTLDDWFSARTYTDAYADLARTLADEVDAITAERDQWRAAAGVDAPSAIGYKLDLTEEEIANAIEGALELESEHQAAAVMALLRERGVVVDGSLESSLRAELEEENIRLDRKRFENVTAARKFLSSLHAATAELARVKGESLRVVAVDTEAMSPLNAIFTHGDCVVRGESGKFYQLSGGATSLPDGLSSRAAVYVVRLERWEDAG